MLSEQGLYRRGVLTVELGLVYGSRKEIDIISFSRVMVHTEALEKLRQEDCHGERDLTLNLKTRDQCLGPTW